MNKNALLLTVFVTKQLATRPVTDEEEKYESVSLKFTLTSYI